MLIKNRGDGNDMEKKKWFPNQRVANYLSSTEFLLQNQLRNYPMPPHPLAAISTFIDWFSVKMKEFLLMGV